MNEKTKNDFLFFQNEILGDVKKVEVKLSEKLSQISSFIETQSEKYDNKIKDLANRINQLSSSKEEKDDRGHLEKSMNQFQKKIEERITKLDVKLNILDKDFNNACFKYDKIFSNNLIVPGLIGVSCPYDTLKPFLEYMNQKIGELLKAKDKQNLDTKKYKEKLESIISQNKAQFEIAQNKINDFCSQGLKKCDIICKDRVDLLEKRMENLRLENGQYAQELKQKTEKIQIDWDKLNMIENNINRKYKEEWNKFSDIVDKLSNNFDKNREEFYLIKNRFTEFNDIIKDGRIRNVGEVNIPDMIPKRNAYKEMSHRIEKNQNREMSNRIDLNKKRRTKRIQNYEFQNELNEKGILQSYDIYNDNHFSQEKNNSNKIIENNNVNNKIFDNNNYEKKMNKKEEIIKYNTIENNQMNKINEEIDEKSKNPKKSKFYNENILNLNENKDKMKVNEAKKNNSREFQKPNNNIMINNFNICKTNKMQDIKFINIKNKANQIDKDNNTCNIINYNNDNSIYNIINYNNHFNSSNPSNLNATNINDKSEQKNYEKSGIIENKEPNNFLEENAKINNLILGADFSENNLYKINGPTYNLSQAYIIIKRRNEELQKIKNNDGKNERKYNQLSPSSIKNNSKYLNNNKSLNFFAKNDTKKINKEDTYLLGNLLNKKANLNLTNHDKNDFPKIVKNYNKENNFNNNIILNINNVNENSYEINSTKHQNEKNTNNKKKLLYSSSDSNILEKKFPITPNLKKRAFIGNDNIDKKNNFKTAKETLNHIKPYLIKKFQDQ